MGWDVYKGSKSFDSFPSQQQFPLHLGLAARSSRHIHSVRRFWRILHTSERILDHFARSIASDEP